MIKPRRNLSRKLSFGIMFLAVPLFVLSLGVFYVQSRELIHQKSSERANNILKIAMQQVVNRMGMVENAAKSNAWLLEENFTPDSLEAISHRIVARNPSIISCTVGAEPNMFSQIGRCFSVYTVNDGDTIITVREPEYEYFGKMWYKKVRNTGKPQWINPFSEYTEGSLDHNDAVASYCLPLHTGNGGLAGVLTTDFSFASLTKSMLTTEPPYPSAYYMLLGGDGRYLVHPKTSLLFKKTIFSDTNANENADLIALGHEMTGGRSGTMHVMIDGEPCHVSYGTVPGTDWSLALVINSDDLLGPYRYLTYIIVAIIIVGLLLIQWLCYRVVKQTITPINQLLEATEKIINGQYDDVIPVSTRTDAVAQLQNGFVAMQRSIMSHMERIEHTAQEIDQYNVEEEDKYHHAEEAIIRKDSFISHVVDHVRKPLNVIHECAVELRDTPAIPKNELAAIAHKMKFNADSLLRLVLMLFDCSETRLADSSMYKKGDKVACNQAAIDCIRYIEDTFLDVKVHFESEIPDDLLVQTNDLYLKRSIRELLYNAAKYSDRQHVLLRITQTPTTVCYTVEDVGPGLPSGLGDSVFEPFMKVDNLSEGFGLGLPLVKRHALALGGNVIYDASYQEGCRFILEIPK